MPRKKVPSLAGFYRSHHKLFWAASAGLGVYAALFAVPNALAWTTRALVAWDALTLSFLTILLFMARGLTPEQLAQHAAEQDEGRLLVLGVSLASAAAAIVAIWHELGTVREFGDAVKAAHTALAFVTVALSWLFTHAIFATHYTHEYYSPDEDDDPQTTQEGLGFPGKGQPDFWDFLHFSLIIGVAMQTADITIQSRALRRVVTLHAIAAFLFNTVILAISINFAAGLFAS